MAETYEELQQKIEAIKQKYQPQIDALKARGEKIKDDFDEPSNPVSAGIGIDFRVDWKDQEFSFGVPTVTVRDQHIIFDLPQVTMVEQNWSFGVPSVCQQDTYPLPGVLIKIPYPCIQQTTIIFHLPSITMVRNDIVMGIPEFSLEQVRWVIGLPQFTVINIKGEITAVQNQSDQLQTDANQVGSAMKQEITDVITEYLNPKASDDQTQRDSVQQKFDAALTRIDAAINEVTNAKGNPEAVPDGKGGQFNLRSLRSDLANQKTDALNQIDAVLQQILNAHVEAAG